MHEGLTRGKKPIVTVVLLWLGCAIAVSPAAASQDPPAPEQVRAVTEQDSNYRLGAADSLMISVIGVGDFGDPGLAVEVSNSGKVHVPYVGVLPVAGMTAGELESEIARRLREQDLMKDPQVTVQVTSYRGNTVYILGEVMQPGQYYMRGEMYLMDLIGLSMGFPTDGIMYLYRRVPARSPAEDAENGALGAETVVAEAIPIDIQQLAQGLRPDLNYRLQGGDMLYVPFNRPRYFFVTGDVGSAGTFEIPPRRELLVSEAIAFAGGPTRTAKASNGILVRYGEDGQREEFPINFDAILEGKQTDFPIAANDIIFIPGSNAKVFGQGFLSFLPNLITLGLL